MAANFAITGSARPGVALDNRGNAGSGHGSRRRLVGRVEREIGLFTRRSTARSRKLVHRFDWQIHDSDVGRITASRAMPALG